ncbi:MAG: glutamate 5-kinase [Propionibacteriaceae bacterium]|jgi:glutamate 5-kinase|nr:glutamate 5-kinase [Propionibacteriaceae bacterium]
MESQLREGIAHARRIVVKVGSSSLASAQGGLNQEAVDHLVDALATRQQSSEVVLVSSGAIAAGLVPLGLTHRPSDLAQQQAAAAVGQGVLLSAYATAFAARHVVVAQVLLSVGDLARKKRYANALQTFGALTRLNVIPIVNENDTVATREIRFGDNDRLAALVAELVRADALILLSDVDGLYTTNPADPDAELISHVPDLSTLTADVDSPGASGVGTGGMASKIEAARIATSAGIPVLLARWDQVGSALSAAVGTVFAPSAPRLSRRHGWLADASFTTGRLHVDAGAARALTKTSASLLAAGIRRVEGDFKAQDPVEVVGPDGTIIARGLVAYSCEELPAMLGRTSSELSHALGTRFGREIIHRDDLVLMTRSLRKSE